MGYLYMSKVKGYTEFFDPNYIIYGEVLDCGFGYCIKKWDDDIGVPFVEPKKVFFVFFEDGVYIEYVEKRKVLLRFVLNQKILSKKNWKPSMGLKEMNCDMKKFFEIYYDDKLEGVIIKIVRSHQHLVEKGVLWW